MANARFVTCADEGTSKSPAAQAMSRTMHAYWTSFITTGDPNMANGQFPIRPYWTPYTTKNGKKMVFGEGSDEFAGGKSVGIPAKVDDDKWAKVESDFWWARTELSEK